MAASFKILPGEKSTWTNLHEETKVALNAWLLWFSAERCRGFSAIHTVKFVAGSVCSIALFLVGCLSGVRLP